MGLWKSFVEKPLKKIGGYAEDVLDTAGNVVNWAVDHPLEAAALVTAGYYFAPQIGAWVSPEGAAIAGTEAGTSAGAATLTAEQVAAQQAASGLSLSDALNYARAGLLVNAVTGDPLGLSGSGGGGDGNAPTGFAMVPIPEDWKSPTYNYTPVQEVKFEDLFPGVSLQGTQWQGMQGAQPNMTFNDIFASGMQQTPMGSPVDINQIVGSILGQNAKS